MGRTLAIVIVNYRTPELVADCLRSLSPELARLGGGRVTVVDGASGDGSVEKLTALIQKENWESWAKVLPLEGNRGFSAGNNAAIAEWLAAKTKPDHILLLNPDTQVRPGALGALLDFIEAHPKAGIVGSRLEEPDGTPQRSAFRFHTALSELDRGLRMEMVAKAMAQWIVAPPVSETECKTGWVSGASMLVRRQVFEDIGLLDDGYFLYYEEVDFCLRAARAGWECWYEPRSRVVHLVGQATGMNEKTEPRRVPEYVWESRRRYFLKNFGRGYTALADSFYTLGHLVWRVRRRIQGRDTHDPPMLFRDFLRHSVFVRGFTL